MTERLVISIISGAGFTAAALATYLYLRHQMVRMVPLIRLAALVAVTASLTHLVLAFSRLGMVEALQSYFSSAVLLSTLLGVVALGVHLSASLKGLDGILFLAAGALGLVEIALAHQAPATLTGRPWFISHGLAFALSAAFFIAGGAAGLTYLLVLRMLRNKRSIGLMGNVAPLESLERFGRWMPIIGFPLFTFGILTGLCGVAHRPDLSRTAWYLDVTFLLSMVAWAVYAYLCAATLYWPIRGRRAAVLSTYGLGLIVVVFFARELSRLHQ